MLNQIYRNPLVVLAILLIAIGLTIYSEVILDGVFLFDDFEYVIGNPIIADFSALKMSDARQVGYLSFAVNYAIGGEDPLGYHLVNVLIHIVNSLLVSLLARGLMMLLNGGQDLSERQSYTAFLAAFLFLVHPVQTQAVSYITQRFTSLATLFYLSAVVLYLEARLRSEQRLSWHGLYAAALVSTVLAMKTKEISFTIPFVLLMFELLLLSGSRFGRTRLLYLLPFAATLAIIPLSIFGPEWGIVDPSPGIAQITRMDKIYDLRERSPLLYLYTQFRAVVTYLSVLLFPVGLRVVYDFPISRTFFELRVILSFLILVGLVAVAVYFWKTGSAAVDDRERSVRYRVVSFGIFWFFVTISVESSFIPIKDVIFEHRVYLPSVGFFISASVCIAYLSERLLAKKAPLVRFLLPALMIGVPLAVGTHMRNEIWTDEFKLWDDVIRKAPGKPIGYNNRGTARAKGGDFAGALMDLDRAVSFFPNNPTEMMAWENADMTPANLAKTYVARGDIHIALGDNDRARADFQRAKDTFVIPVDVDSVMRTADRYARLGAHSHAVEEYNKILEWDPENLKVLNDRANSFSFMKRYPEAIRDFSRIISIDPDFTLAYHNRGVAYAWSGNHGKATEDFRKACAMGFQSACESIAILDKKQ